MGLLIAKVSRKRYGDWRDISSARMGLSSPTLPGGVVIDAAGYSQSSEDGILSSTEDATNFWSVPEY
eukprot:scaffold6987_cov72-Cyclotella_meneghiniana.AAC.3